MSDLKAAQFAEKHDLMSKLKANLETGTIDVPEDYYESTLPEGLTVDQLKKLQKHHQSLLAGTVYAAGGLARDTFKENEDLGELSLSWKEGHMVQDVFYTREPAKGESPVRTVASFKEPNRSDTNKAMKAVAAMFDEI